VEWDEGDPIIARTAGVGMDVQVHNVVEGESTDPLRHDRTRNSESVVVVDREGSSVVSGGV